MKIRKLKYHKHPILGNLNLDFTDKDGNAINTIIIAGENGVGKSALLNSIFKIFPPNLSNDKKGQKLEVEIELTNEELDILKNASANDFPSDIPPGNIFRITFNYDIINDWDQIYIEMIGGGNTFRLPGYIFNIPRVTKVLFSDVEVNFNPKEITSIKAGNIDNVAFKSEKSNSDLATQIAQLLIDIQSIDAQELTQWIKENKGKAPDESIIDVRTKRFTSAFEYMFPTKKLKGVENHDNKKQLMFEEFNRTMPIGNLSSGEKQIVFRGSFLLKDKKSSTGSLVLIDEPEISLHPTWQLKILNYFQKLFTNEIGEQTSQLIVTTHSPFILHNSNRIADRVIILKKDSSGNTEVLADPKFFSWSGEKTIQEAFNIESMIKTNGNTVFLEGETDETYFQKCIEIFGAIDLCDFEWIGRTNETGTAEFSGGSGLNHAKLFFTANPQFLKHQITLLYDNDTNKPEEIIGKLSIMKMSKNLDNSIFKIGVENLLTLIPEINLSSFYKENTKTDNYGAQTIIQELDKKALCSFVCNKLNIAQQKIVLSKVMEEIKRILKKNESCPCSA